MDSQNNPPEFLLLFRGTHWDKGLSPEETQAILSKWTAWYDRLTSEGKLKGGQPLEHEGKIVSGKRGAQVADGPFAESKEAIAGYFLLRVDTIEEATAIARDCPTLDYGLSVEVRPVAERCPAMERTGVEFARASS